ncbi:Putative nitroreductase [Septoria linicola]|uniref:Nitroreductase n=1 Tax=Septoria linicola TaxID=215465 RepID=A0A9Q9EJI5_9PEZI|nr:putative nitroreductase [Septoria linicola]USW51378.1 Putative nitroreductase [Septoria linicola]
MAKTQATTQGLFAAAETRLSCYELSKESPILDSRIQEIISTAVKHAPSSFNVQSARAVILLKDDHDALWSIADKVSQAVHPEAYEKMLGKMISGFSGAYGTVLWLEDQEALDGLAAKNPLFSNLVPQWGDHSSGMHQFIAWTALELEGLGCNLQHFNFIDDFEKEVTKKWDLPATWKLKSQLVFGKPVNGLVRKRPRTYAPLEDRVKVFGA